MIIDYIRNISEQLNKQYPGIMNRDRYDNALEMFKDSDLSYEEVVNQINAFAHQQEQNSTPIQPSQTSVDNREKTEELEEHRGMMM